MQRISLVESVVVHPATVSGKRYVVVHASGQVPTSGWRNPQLAAWYYFAVPQDGIQDFAFYADEPKGIVLQVISHLSSDLSIERDVADYWGPGKPLKGVRIHAAQNVMEASPAPRPELDVRPFSEGMPLPWPIPWSSGAGDQGGEITARVRIMPVG